MNYSPSCFLPVFFLWDDISKIFHFILNRKIIVFYKNFKIELKCFLYINWLIFCLYFFFAEISKTKATTILQFCQQFVRTTLHIDATHTFSIGFKLIYSINFYFNVITKWYEISIKIGRDIELASRYTFSFSSPLRHSSNKSQRIKKRRNVSVNKQEETPLSFHWRNHIGSSLNDWISSNFCIIGNVMSCEDGAFFTTHRQSTQWQ